MKPKIKRKRTVRDLVEQAILIARLQTTSQAELESTLHLVETQAFALKTAKAVDCAVLKGLSKKLNSLSNQLARP